MRLREHPGIVGGRIDILNCDPKKIKLEDGYNVRDLTTPEARAELDELKASVKQNGIITPLKIRFNGEDIILVEGHRRRTVVLELIDEFKKSGGTEGLKIESVPIFAEAPGTNEIDRDFGLETSNSGTRLKPLELANLIFRLKEVRGVPLDEIARRLGKTPQSVKQTLALRALPEERKQDVRDGTMSATLAAKLEKEDPEFVERLKRENEEENKRLGIGAKRKQITPKKVAKAKEAAKPKAEPPKAPEPTKDEPKTAVTTRPTSEELREYHRAPDGATAATPQPAADEAPPHEQPGEPVTADLSQSYPPSAAHQVKKLISDALIRFAKIGEDAGIAEKNDDDLVEVKVADLKMIWRAYNASIGDVP